MLRGDIAVQVCALVVCAGGPVACGPTIKASFESAEPGARNAAIVQAAARNSPADIPNLVRMLESDDPATRTLAIAALERITGETLAYDATSEPGERAAPVARWEQYVREHTPPRGAPKGESP